MIRKGSTVMVIAGPRFFGNFQSPELRLNHKGKSATTRSGCLLFGFSIFFRLATTTTTTMIIARGTAQGRNNRVALNNDDNGGGTEPG
jgi:hypothetical protein